MNWKAKQYAFERDIFVSCFKEVCIDKGVSLSDLLDVLDNSFSTDEFVCHRGAYSDFFILHKESLLTITWYKHLGRCNGASKPIGVKTLYKFVELLIDELLDERMLTTMKEGDSNDN